MDDRYSNLENGWADDWQAKIEVLEEEPVSVALCQPEIPQGLP
jgi:hypothetical protein